MYAAFDMAPGMHDENATEQLGRIACGKHWRESR